MKDLIFDHFQNIVSDSLVRHKSIIDILTKLQESEARLNRAIAKSVTACGCLEISAKKQDIPKELPDDITLEDFYRHMNSHVSGELCENCREVLEKEMGNNIFYMVSLCNILNINLYDVFLKEYNKLKMLGKYDMR
jgi:hypothetical protein